jgi:hypothetical protein
VLPGRLRERRRLGRQPLRHDVHVAAVVRHRGGREQLVHRFAHHVQGVPDRLQVVRGLVRDAVDETADEG